MKTKKLLTVVLLVLTTSLITAQDYNQPKKIFNRNFDEVFKEYTQSYSIGKYKESYIVWDWSFKEGIEIQQNNIFIEEDAFPFIFVNDSKNYILYGSNYLFIFGQGRWTTIEICKPKSFENYLSNYYNGTNVLDYGNLLWKFQISDIQCSSFYTETLKSGTVKYIPYYLNVIINTFIDESEFISHTPWVPGKENNSSGIGEYLDIEFTEPKDNLVVLNGYVDLEKRYLYKANNRVKTAVITSLDEENPFEMEYEFEDYVHFSEIDFPCEVNKVRFTIKEVYKGEKWDDTCITAVITRWEEDSKKEKHVGGGGGYAFDDEGNILK